MTRPATSAKSIFRMAQNLADSGMGRQDIFDELNAKYPNRERDLAEILCTVFSKESKEGYGKYFLAMWILPIAKAIFYGVNIGLLTEEMFILIPYYLGPFAIFCVLVVWLVSRRERILFANALTWTMLMLVFDLLYAISHETYLLGLLALLMNLGMYYASRMVDEHLFQTYHIHSKRVRQPDGTIRIQSEVRFPD